MSMDFVHLDVKVLLTMPIINEFSNLMHVGAQAHPPREKMHHSCDPFTIIIEIAGIRVSSKAHVILRVSDVFIGVGGNVAQ